MSTYRVIAIHASNDEGTEEHHSQLVLRDGKPIARYRDGSPVESTSGIWDELVANESLTLEEFEVRYEQGEMERLFGHLTEEHWVEAFASHVREDSPQGKVRRTREAIA